eukprot:1087137_1
MQSNHSPSNHGASTNVLCLLILSLRIYLCDTLSYTCNAPYSCSNMSIDNVTDNIWCSGYRSCTSSTINASSFIQCYGEQSCSGSSLILVGAYHIRCSGYRSCESSTITARHVRCRGAKSCFNSTITLLHEPTPIKIEAQGAFCLANSIVQTDPDHDVTFNVNLDGFQAAFGSQILCATGSVCTVNCRVNGCQGLYVEGLGISVNLNSAHSVAPITDLADLNQDEFNQTVFEMLLLGSNDESCTTQNHTLRVDVNVHNESYIVNESIMSGNETMRICVRASQAYAKSIINNDTSQTVICTAGGSICASGTIQNNQGDVVCNGEGSCLRADISNVKNIMLGGKGSLYAGKIISDGDLNVYFMGATSGQVVKITCNEGDTCHVHCGGFQSCDKNPVITCAGQCSLKCDLDSECPSITYPPTKNPTHPTNDPTKNPQTPNPTGAPTDPTNAPTFCGEYDYDMNSNDGRNETRFDMQNVNISHYLMYITDDNNTFTTTVSDDFADADIKCDSIHCLVQCNHLASCLLTNISTTHQNNGTMAVFCKEAYSCLSATISSFSSANTLSIALSCIEKNSCTGMDITVGSFGSLVIYCTHTGACNDMIINIVNENPDTNGKNDGLIHCVAPNSCNNLHVKTTSPRTRLIMYQSSVDVILDNNIGYLSTENNIDCNTNRFIRFEGDMTETTESVSLSILNEYEDRLPCSDVHVSCGNSSCDMTYYVNPTKVEALNQQLTSGCYWLNTQIIQRVFCEGECEESPTEPPTSSPTSAPTNPTVNPTVDPTNAPSIPPTLSPSYSPTDAPSFSPTNIPSFSPTYMPSRAPTSAPSISPTYSPSSAPSNAPSSSPTAAPTRLPTHNVDAIYEYYVSVKYSVSKLTANNIDFIVNNTETAVNAMQEIIERNYHAKETLEYHQFYVYIKSINDKYIADEEIPVVTAVDLAVLYLNEPMILDTNIDCEERVKDSIIIKTETPSFQKSTQTALRQYFSNDDLEFKVSDDAVIAFEKFPPSSESVNWNVVYLSVFIVSCGILFSLCAFTINKMESTKADNGAFTVPILVSLGMYDFASDINFAVQIWGKASFKLKDIMTWLAAGSTFFTVLPLVSNMLYAMRISRQKTIQQNPAARAWFQSHLNAFLLICFACAGTYPALSLVSSGIFGLDFFESGLLPSELHQLSKIKIQSTVFMENIPQTIIQVVYSSIRNSIEGDALLAFIASILSICASLIVYQAQKDQLKEGHIHKYFVSFYNNYGATEEQQKKIRQKCKLKAAMSEALASVFEVPTKTIVIGFVTSVPTGCVIHIQHFIFNDDMQALRGKLLKEINDGLGTRGFDVQVTPELFIRSKYDKKRRKAADALSLHFFGKRDRSFSVEYHRKLDEASDNAITPATPDPDAKIELVLTASAVSDTGEERKTDFHQDDPNEVGVAHIEMMAFNDTGVKITDNGLKTPIEQHSQPTKNDDMIGEMFKSMQEMQSIQMKSIQEMQSTQKEMQSSQSAQMKSMQEMQSTIHHMRHKIDELEGEK